MKTETMIKRIQEKMPTDDEIKVLKIFKYYTPVKILFNYDDDCYSLIDIIRRFSSYRKKPKDYRREILWEYYKLNLDYFKIYQKYYPIVRGSYTIKMGYNEIGIYFSIFDSFDGGLIIHNSGVFLSNYYHLNMKMMEFLLSTYYKDILKDIEQLHKNISKLKILGKQFEEEKKLLVDRFKMFRDLKGD